MSPLILPGPGGAGSPPPTGPGFPLIEVPPHVATQAIVCRECGVLAYVPVAMVPQLTELHARACLAPKVAAIADNVDTLLTRLTVLADTLRVRVRTARAQGDEDDDQEGDELVGGAGGG